MQISCSNQNQDDNIYHVYREMNSFTLCISKPNPKYVPYVFRQVAAIVKSMKGSLFLFLMSLLI